MSDYPYCCLAIAKDKDKANQLAAIIDPDVGGAQTFDKGRALRRLSDGEPGWAADPLLKQTGFEIIAEFATGGYPQVLLNAGLTHAQLDGYRDALILRVGTRANLEGRLLEFVAESGYELDEAE